MFFSFIFGGCYSDSAVVWGGDEVFGFLVFFYEVRGILVFAWFFKIRWIGWLVLKMYFYMCKVFSIMKWGYRC